MGEEWWEEVGVVQGLVVVVGFMCWMCEQMAFVNFPLAAL